MAHSQVDIGTCRCQGPACFFLPQRLMRLHAPFHGFRPAHRHGCAAQVVTDRAMGWTCDVLSTVEWDEVSAYQEPAG